ncbi:hypothetical protein AMTR_s00056p00160500 [Amborella trichopoda]|uniref:Uncharacterized protein n=1 Tax=Amborella trichopoda TaxID=13333 RepID=U5D4B0_AMBTC|nr:hypothetical protein AMTR_s00056p00160500 [Amborella trichopoda]
MTSKWVRSDQVMHYSSAPLKEEKDEEEVIIAQRRLPADYDPENFDPTEHRGPPTDQVMHYSSAPLKEEEDEEEVIIAQRQLPADYDPENFDPTEHRGPPTDRVFRLVDEISGLTLFEVSELSEIMMKKLGMKEILGSLMKYLVSHCLRFQSSLNHDEKASNDRDASYWHDESWNGSSCYA